MQLENMVFWIDLRAVDTQLYIEFNPLSQHFLNIETQIIQLCINEVKNWKIQNKLQLNQNKTESLVVQTRYKFQSGSVDRMSWGESESQVVCGCD